MFIQKPPTSCSTKFYLQLRISRYFGKFSATFQKGTERNAPLKPACFDHPFPLE